MLGKKKKYDEIYNKVSNELKKEEFHPEFHQFLLWQYHYLHMFYRKLILNIAF